MVTTRSGRQGRGRDGEADAATPAPQRRSRTRSVSPARRRSAKPTAAAAPPATEPPPARRAPRSRSSSSRRPAKVPLAPDELSSPPPSSKSEGTAASSSYPPHWVLAVSMVVVALLWAAARLGPSDPRLWPSPINKLPLWYPERVHPVGRQTEYFEGWYFKMVTRNEAESFAVIAGVFYGRNRSSSEDDLAFVMVLDGPSHRCYMKRFAVSEFTVDAGDRFAISIGQQNHFREDGFAINLVMQDDDKNTVTVRGRVNFGQRSPWPISLAAPGAMGWFSYMPFMECYHGVLSMSHGLTGELTIVDSEALKANMPRSHDLSGGVGYNEKDWGVTFPSTYIWLASNHFGALGANDAGPNATALFLSVARIPLPMNITSFTGFLCSFQHAGIFYPFATWTGASIEELSETETHARIVLRDRRHRLTMVAEKQSNPVMLYAPRHGEMRPVIPEALGDGSVDVIFAHRDNDTVIFAGTGRNAGLEIFGSILAEWN